MRVPVVRAVDGISFDLMPGEALGIVGESGCGKSTLGRAILNLQPATAGEISWQGRKFPAIGSTEMRAMRRHMQIIFQDPLASLDPHLTVESIIGLPLRTFQPELGAAEIRRQVHQIMERVGLPLSAARLYPHQFSGGQCQRIGIARALVLRPRLIICDEPTSALDVSVQAQIINLLLELRHEYGLSLLFISHNLTVVRHLCDRVLVLYLGKVVESAPATDLFANPRHPYTRSLLAAAPRITSDGTAHLPDLGLRGEPPSPINPPRGCPFVTRCALATAQCDAPPELASKIGGKSMVACHFA
jgi:oligopeptide transport system ATP-binding protein